MQSSIKLGNWRVSHITSEQKDPILLPRQTHGNTITQAALCVHRITEADGIIGTSQDAPFGIHTADCLPLVVTTDTRAAAIHISRHTLTAGILNTLTAILDGEALRNAYIGPHICEQCFVFEEKGENIIRFEKMFPHAIQERNHMTHISLRRVVYEYLKDIGMRKKFIIQDIRCTFETPELSSYRRWMAGGEQGDFPRMITAVFGKNICVRDAQKLSYILV